MGENTKIEWTHHTFNPWIGCQKVGPGCDHCYAEGWADRFGKDFSIPQRTSQSNWNKPLKWNAEAERLGIRYRVFCASLSDVFDNRVPTAWRIDLFALIAKTPHLDWLIVTKRVGNVMKMCSGDGLMFDMIANRVWLGASICTQPEADRDIKKLLAVPAAKHFLSMEPLLARVDLERACDIAEAEMCRGSWDQMQDPQRCALALRHGSIRLLDWVIVGGESGQKARPMHPDWVRSLRDQCAEAGVPFLFKQWGEWMPAAKDRGRIVLSFPIGSPTGPAQPEFHEWPDGDVSARVGKKAAGRLLDGVQHDGYPEARP